MANNLMRFDPFGDLATFEQLRNINDLFSGLGLLSPRRMGEQEPRIKIDVSETDKEYLVKADIPGIKKEDIKVSIAGNQVSISAEVKQQTEEKIGAALVRCERYSGQQSRIFTLPQEVDDTKAVAKYEDGVLQLSLPKKPGGGGPKPIAIH